MNAAATAAGLAAAVPMASATTVDANPTVRALHANISAASELFGGAHFVVEDTLCKPTLILQEPAAQRELAAGRKPRAEEAPAACRWRQRQVGIGFMNCLCRRQIATPFEQFCRTTVREAWTCDSLVLSWPAPFFLVVPQTRGHFALIEGGSVHVAGMALGKRGDFVAFLF